MPHYGMRLAWSSEDQVYVASCPELGDLSAHGAAPVEAAAPVAAAAPVQTQAAPVAEAVASPTDAQLIADLGLDL